MAESSNENLLTTPLDSLHREAGARMVPFAGYAMPVQYKEGIITEHLHTREQAGLFDVSHMGQVIVKGEGATEAFEKILPIDVAALKDNQQCYSVLPNEEGGILDDLIITRWSSDTFFVVVNAACKEQDFAHFQKHLEGCELTLLDDRALLALQGPTAKDVMQALAPAACELTFMNGTHVSIAGFECYVTRSGYTGEDGFEISVLSSEAAALTEALLKFEQVKLIGLGARDSLRLEAGLCLYGHDMSTDTTAIEASLLWSITKSRRPDSEKAGGYLGADQVADHIANGAPKKRVGFWVEGRGPVREGAEIVDADGNKIGEVTSGVFSPSLEKPIAMGYVETAYAKVDTEVTAMVRGKPRKLTVAKTPFVPQRYFRG